MYQRFIAVHIGDRKYLLDVYTHVHVHCIYMYYMYVSQGYDVAVDSTCTYTCSKFINLPRSSDKQFFNEVLCITGHGIKHIIFKVIITRGDIQECLLMCLSLEW